ncbi:MAG: cupin domain-containing protein, partial [Acidaminococcaceae bacterium]|nr:cupin domain-containing protein [Acidaminococcaceae bacterium]
EYANLELVEAPRKAVPAKGFTFAAEKFNSPNFNKPVYLGRTVTTPNAAGAPAYSYVFFPKGVYNKWHMHGEGQILIATDGIGLHQMRNGEIQVMRPGDVAYCPPGETHWHGAAPDSSFAHLAVSPAGKHTVEWYDFLDKKEYKKAAVK